MNSPLNFYPEQTVALARNSVSLAPSTATPGLPIVKRAAHLVALVVTALSLVPALFAAPQDSGALPTAVRLSAAEEAHVSALLNATRRIALNEIATLLWRNPSDSGTDRQWQALMKSFDPIPVIADQRLLLKWTLRNAYLEADREVQFHSEQADAFVEAQVLFREEALRARRWIESHRSTGAQMIDPPFLPDAKLDRPKPVLGPKPPVTHRALATLQEVNRYAMGLERQYQQMGEDAQLAQLAAQRAGMRQRRLIDQAETIATRLIAGIR